MALQKQPCVRICWLEQVQEQLYPKVTIYYLLDLKNELALKFTM